LITKAGLHWIGPIIVAIKIWWNCSLGMVEKLEHHGPVRLLEHGFKIQMVVIHMYKGTSVLFYLISINLTIQSWGYLQRSCRYQGPENMPMCENNHNGPNLAIMASFVVRW